MDTIGLMIIISVVLFLVIILILARVLLSSKKQDRTLKERKYWVEISELLDLDYDQKGKKLQGIYRGRNVILDEFEPLGTTVGLIAFAAGTAYTEDPMSAYDILRGRVRIHAEIENPTGGYLSILKNNVDSALLRLLTPRAQTGIEEIDRNFQVESKPPEFAANVFSSQRLQDRFLDFPHDYQTSIVVHKNKLHLHVKGLEISNESILTAFDLACDFADEIDKLT